MALSHIKRHRSSKFDIHRHHHAIRHDDDFIARTRDIPSTVSGNVKKEQSPNMGILKEYPRLPWSRARRHVVAQRQVQVTVEVTVPVVQTAVVSIGLDNFGNPTASATTTLPLGLSTTLVPGTVTLLPSSSLENVTSGSSLVTTAEAFTGDGSSTGPEPISSNTDLSASSPTSTPTTVLSETSPTLTITTASLPSTSQPTTAQSSTDDSSSSPTISISVTSPAFTTPISAELPSTTSTLPTSSSTASAPSSTTISESIGTTSSTPVPVFLSSTTGVSSSSSFSSTTTSATLSSSTPTLTALITSSQTSSSSLVSSSRSTSSRSDTSSSSSPSSSSSSRRSTSTTSRTRTSQPTRTRTSNTSSSTRLTQKTSRTSSARSSQSSTDSPSSSPSLTNAGGWFGTDGPAQPTNTAGNSNGTLSAVSDDNNTPTPVIVGSVVGSLAGVALIFLALLYLFRYSRRRRAIANGNANSALGEDPFEDPPQSQGGMTQHNSSLLPAAAAAGFFSRLSRHSQPQQERGFQKVSGRKLPSQFSPGMEVGPGGLFIPTYSDNPTAEGGATYAAGGIGAMSDRERNDISPGPQFEPSNINDPFRDPVDPQQSDPLDYYHASTTNGDTSIAQSSALLGPASAAGFAHERARNASSTYSLDTSGAYTGMAVTQDHDDEQMRPSPARTPTVHHPAPLMWNRTSEVAQPGRSRTGRMSPGGHGAGGPQPWSPPISPVSSGGPSRQGTLGRSHPSYDGSRGSRFSEDV